MNNKEEAAARAAKQHYILNGSAPGTFSAMQPAYAGTALEAKKGIQPYGPTRKICLKCRRSYEADVEQCECGGHLYTANDYYQKKGADAR